MNETKISKIAIIDDNPENLKLLGKMLENQNYEVYAFNNGDSAIKAIIKDIPDLILLDISMPGKSGYEVCRELKQNKDTAEIPIIFLSALIDTEAKVLAFKNGGVDYITKPFQFVEVEARVRNHLQLSEMRKLLENEKKRLEAVVEDRTKELIEAYKKIRIFDKMKSDVLNKVSGEINSPLGKIFKLMEKLFINGGESIKKEKEEYLNNKSDVDSILNDVYLLNKIEFYDEKPQMKNEKLDEIITEIDKIDDIIDFKLNRDIDLKGIHVWCNTELLKKGFEIILDFAKTYSNNMKIIMKTRSDNDYIFISFVLQNFLLNNDQMFDFIGYNNIEEKNSNASISNILAHRIITMLSGDLYIEKINGEVLITVKLPRTEGFLNE